MSDYENVKVMELIKKLGQALDGTVMKTSVTALALCLAHAIDEAGSEGSEVRKYANKVINDMLEMSQKHKGKWGKLLAKLME